MPIKFLINTKLYQKLTNHFNLKLFHPLNKGPNSAIVPITNIRERDLIKLRAKI